MYVDSWISLLLEVSKSAVLIFQVKKDEVGLYLHKAHPGSWTAQLSSVGIEHYHGASWTSWHLLSEWIILSAFHHSVFIHSFSIE